MLFLLFLHLVEVREVAFGKIVELIDCAVAGLVTIAYIVTGANGNVRGKKVTSLARWPPNPSRCWALTWRTIGPMEDYWARSGGLLAEWPLSTSGGVFPLTRLTTDA